MTVPIEDHAIIGDLRTIALVGRDGAIDWFCYPFFDSPSVFAQLLDEEKGGHFKVWATHPDTVRKQLYWPDTNVVLTRFYTEEGVGEMLDFMPVPLPHHPIPRRIIRHVRGGRGRVRFEHHCRPAFNYARDPHTVSLDAHGALFESATLSLRLTATVPLELAEDGGVRATFELSEGEDVAFILQEPQAEPLTCAVTREIFLRTVEYWRHWLGRCTYRGRWRETVQRSALVLKLLTFAPTGAIVAAPTASLPERRGGTRNWDYRYTWIRDAAFTIYAFMRIGFTEEAGAFMRWLEERIHLRSADGRLGVMHRIHGHEPLTEQVLPHLAGYAGSHPVRIGNDAESQLQLDIYGELMDSVYLYNKYGEAISADFWVHLRRMVNWVCDHWREPDHGIWEVRGPVQHFVYSKLMCWVAVDRGLRLADKRSFPADRERWLHVRDAIYEDILSYGWSEARGAFRLSYESESLDAANLVMPLTFFMAPTDPQMLRTIDAISRPPREGGLSYDGLPFRYDAEILQDGMLAENEGTFNLCTFWLVEALTRAGRSERRRLEQARQLFERMLGYANHVGLYAEQIGRHGEALGNFPQALTHLSLISAAFNLDRTLGARD